MIIMIGVVTMHGRIVSNDDCLYIAIARRIWGMYSARNFEEKMTFWTP